MYKIFYGIFYVFLTIIIIYLFINDKYITNLIEKAREPLLNKIYLRFNIKKGVVKKRITGIFDWIQTIIIALILVLLIQYFYLGNYTVPTSSMYPTIIPGERFFADKVSYKFREPERSEIIVFIEPLKDKERYTKRLIGLPGEYVEIKDNSVIINDKEYSTGIIYHNRNTLISDDKWKVPESGDIIKLRNGIFEISEKMISQDNLKTELEKNRDLLKEIVIIDGEFILNDNISTGPIYDRDILFELINGNSVLLKEGYYFVLGDNSMNSLDSRYWGFVSENRMIGKMMFRIWPLNKIGVVK